jgi:hypothetical protein
MGIGRDWIDRTIIVRGPDTAFITADEFRRMFGFTREDFEELIGKGAIPPPRLLGKVKKVYTFEHVAFLNLWLHLMPSGDDYGRRRGPVVEGPTEKPSYVYFIGDGDKVKIGTAGNVDKRLAALQCATARRLGKLLVIPGSFRDENRLHKRFAAYRLSGEWFQFSDEIREFIDQAKAAQDQ